ncbi:hypothetical protein BS78_02G064200 [Paspalum vaginatum]|nr:hypothetical protein BS78_02G064200 [Paspalum vaginatum]
MSPLLPLRLLLPPLLLLASASGSAELTPPPGADAPWPDQYHAVIITNLTDIGGRLRQIDIYYDWPRGRALNIVRDQLMSAAAPPLVNVQWSNGTNFIFDAASCDTIQFPVGVLPPDWKTASAAAYLGRRRLDGFDCHVWSNFIFARYYEDVATGYPVAWDGVNGVQHVLSFEVGGVMQDCSMWQAPAYCFDGGSSAGDPASA